MLKYSLNGGDVVKSVQELSPISFSLVDYGDSDRFLAEIRYDGSCRIANGDTLYVRHSFLTDTGTHLMSTEFAYVKKYSVETSDKEDNVISVLEDRSFRIELSAIDFDYTDTNLRTFILSFNDKHMFSYGEACDISIEITHENETTVIGITCDFVDDTKLKWTVDMGSKTDVLLANHFFKECRYVRIGDSGDGNGYVVLSELPEKAHFSSPKYVLVRGVTDNYDGLYVNNIGSPSVGGEVFSRSNFFFTEGDTVTLLINTSTFSASFPIEQKFDTETFRDTVLNELYAKSAGILATPYGTSVEKDVYHPVKIDAYGKAHKAGKMVFNLHFRKRDLSNGWSNPSDDAFWNGTDDSTPDFPRISEAAYNSQQTPHAVSPFVDNRSDLLSKIGFTDGDVKFQKSKLSKSFLRLSFYTSTNRATQLMVGYATIFFDCGKAYGKYIKHSNDFIYFKPENDNSTSPYSVVGHDSPISVSREVYNSTSVTDYDVFESYRLSTQFTVADRFSDTYSSEGYYLYMYRDYSSELPKDLYMKVEFNHAGYGRIIPMFLPSYIETVDLHKGIKTYEQILEDWTSPNEGYGFEKYNAYSYVHLKYRYDFALKKHVYYMDDEYYGNEVLYENGRDVIINLYEPKVVLK